MSQWEDNNRAIEYFLYESDWTSVNTVIVGSSLSYRMTAQNLPYPDSVINLSLGGQSIYEGLEILNRSGFCPEYLLVETNVLYKKPMDGYMERFFIPGLYFLSKNFNAFREHYRPVNFAQYFYMGIRNHISRFWDKSIKREKKVLSARVNVLRDSATVDKSVLKVMNQERMLKNYSRLLEKSDWELIFSNLQNWLNFYKQMRTRVYLFEMPSDRNIMESDLNVFIRNSLQKAKFIGYQHILAEPDYATTDGLHISVKDANDHLNKLLEYI